jgi:hypothetical protein
VIEATIRIVGESQDVTDGPCELPVLPPIGGHIAVIDRNANHQVLLVEDVVIGAVAKEMLKANPNTSRWGLRVTIFCQEAFGHPLRIAPE